MVGIGIASVSILIVSQILLSSDRLQARTTRRAEVQAGARQALAIMTTELRQAGADPSIPAAGIVPLVAAQSNMIHVRSDLNGNGSIQTAEPSEDVVYSFSDSASTITRNPGSGAAVLLRNVTDMQFTYFDAAGVPLTSLPLSTADAALVHVIGVTLTSEDRDSNPITLSTQVMLRNQ